MNVTRRQMLASGLAATSGSLIGTAGAQQAYPTGVIKFIIPTAVGGGFDIMMRLIGQKLTEAWGQPCIVDARSGASGSIAAQATAKAPADGHTLMMAQSAFVSNQLLLKNPGYKLTDFVPVSMLVVAPIALGVRESLGVKTLKELVAYAKAHPGKLSYGTYGPGSGAHFIGELLKLVAGVHITHIPYRGEAPAGTPQPVISKIALEVNRIIKMPDIAKKILELGFEPVGWSPEHVNTFLREQMAITKKLVDGGRIQI